MFVWFEAKLDFYVEKPVKLRNYLNVCLCFHCLFAIQNRGKEFSIYPFWRDFQIDLNSSSSAPLPGKERRLMMGGIKGIGKTWEEAVRPMLPDMQVQ